MKETVIVLDFETTGLSPRQGARPTEVAAVVLEGNSTVDRFSSLMNPGVPIPRQIQSLTGITNKMVSSAPSVATVMMDFANLKMTGRYHRAEADAEITAKLWVEMKNEIKRCCQIDSVPIDLMEHIQKVPCRSMKRHVHRYLG